MKRSFGGLTCYDGTTSPDFSCPMQMDLLKGFQVEQPDVFVPWGTSEAHFQQAFESLRSRPVTHGYFTAHCVSLGGLSHELGFHFHPRGDGGLVELEFFRTFYSDLAASYQEFQQHLEDTFGKPGVTAPGSEGFPSHTWRLAGADVMHFVRERFGPEEHVRIKRTS